MKKRLLCIVLCLALSLNLFGCQTASPSPTPAESTAAVAPTMETTEPPTEPAPTPEEVYAAASDALAACSDLTLKVSYTLTRKLGSLELTETAAQDITYADIGTDSFIAAVNDTTTLGTTTTTSEMVYSGGKCYTTVNSFLFLSEIETEDFMGSQYPIGLIDSSLYNSVTEQDDGTLLFSDPSDTEAWVGSTGFTDAQAVVTLSGDRISSVTYTASYQVGSVPCKLDMTMEVVSDSAEDVSGRIPESEDDCIPSDYPQLPIMMAASLGLLGDMDTLSINVHKLMYSEAAAAQFASDTTYSATGTGKDYEYYGYESKFLNTSSGSVFVESEESCLDGTYEITASIDGRTETQSLQVNPAMLEKNNKETFSASLASLDYVSSLTLDSFSDYLIIRFTGNDAFADLLQGLVCEGIMGKSTVLSTMATDFYSDVMEGFLVIDPVTLLPVSYSVDFEGAHVIQGSEYFISNTTKMDYDFYDLNVFYDIFDEIPEEPVPEAPATPLFYKVTDDAGHTMWLMGTIHIGDNRTAYLPQEIYDAFDSSDALALEFDSEKFNAEIESNPQLLAEKTYYMDGASLSDHVSEDVFELVCKALEVAGQNSANADAFRPFTVFRIVSSMLATGGYNFSGKMGVEGRLTSRAHEQDKQILEVESGMFQLSLFDNASDELMEYILRDTLLESRYAYEAETCKLYELWCSGDEEAVIATLNEEENMDETEKALNDEYQQIMIIDRNAGMLEVAKGYLESGKTVFFAVGLAHLLQGNGLVQGLRDAGYTVELVTYA